MRVSVGQVPARPLLVTINDGARRIDLSGYTGAELHLRSPEGAAVSTTAGATTLTPTGVRYVWPPVSLFATPGDYRVQVVLTAPGVRDYTEAGTIEAVRAV